MADASAQTKPDPSHSAGGRLGAGDYYGAIEGRFATRVATLTDVVHRGPRALPRHDHACAYFCMLVGGQYQETVGSRGFDYSPFDVGFHPAQVPHRDVVGPRGGRFLCVEIAAQSLQDADVRIGGSARMLPSDATIRLLRIYRELLNGTLSAIEVDSVMWELCGNVAGKRSPRERSVPAWMRRCLEIVEDDDACDVSIAALAHRVGVHPVHLSREFRARFRQTLAEYVQKVRVRRACATIADDDQSLAHVAANAGFADQSHFCRVFRRHVGCAPSAYAARVRSRRR